MDQEGWLYQFREPGFQEMLRVKELIAAMPVYLPRRERRSLASAPIVVEGSLEEAVARLADLLRDDYANNVVEREKRPWDFDYVVTQNGLNKGAVEVYTRVFNPRDSSMGNSLYGRTVRRTSDATYRLWANE